MTDAPEMIWACMSGPMVGLFVSGGDNMGWPSYRRADLPRPEDVAEIARLRAALVEITHHPCASTNTLIRIANAALSPQPSGKEEGNG